MAEPPGAPRHRAATVDDVEAVLALYRLAVDPAHRRRGVAAGLLAAAEERFVALGGPRADAMVLEGNDGAHGLWRAAGYAPQPRWRRWVKAVSADRSGS